MGWPRQMLDRGPCRNHDHRLQIFSRLRHHSFTSSNCDQHTPSNPGNTEIGSSLIPGSYRDVRTTLQDRVSTSFEASNTMFTSTTTTITTELNITSNKAAKIPIDCYIPPSFQSSIQSLPVLRHSCNILVHSISSSMVHQ